MQILRCAAWVLGRAPAGVVHDKPCTQCLQCTARVDDLLQSPLTANEQWASSSRSLAAPTNIGDDQRCNSPGVAGTALARSTEPITTRWTTTALGWQPCCCTCQMWRKEGRLSSHRCSAAPCLPLLCPSLLAVLLRFGGAAKRHFSRCCLVAQLAVLLQFWQVLSGCPACCVVAILAGAVWLPVLLGSCGNPSLLCWVWLSGLQVALLPDHFKMKAALLPWLYPAQGSEWVDSSVQQRFEPFSECAAGHVAGGQLSAGCAGCCMEGAHNLVQTGH